MVLIQINETKQYLICDDSLSNTYIIGYMFDDETHRKSINSILSMKKNLKGMINFLNVTHLKVIHSGVFAPPDNVKYSILYSCRNINLMFLRLSVEIVDSTPLKRIIK